MRLKCILLQFIIILPLFSQNSTLTEIDSILNESYNKFVELQFMESLMLADKSLLLSKEHQYEKGQIYSNLYIARVLQEFGLKMEVLRYIQNIENEKYLKEDPFVEAEIQRLKGRIASSQRLYSLEKSHYLKQLEISEKITDTKKKQMSITMAYFFIQHLYAKQNKLDSAEVYQNKLKEHLSISNDSVISYYYISSYIDKGLLYTNLGRYDEAAEQLDKSLDLIQNSNKSLLFYSFQIYGDLEMARGDTLKAISYYKRALDYSVGIGINHKTKYLHKKLADCLINNEHTVDEAKRHLREYNSINDSLERHNRMVVDMILSDVIKDSDEASAQKSKIYKYIVMGLIFVSILIVSFFFAKNRRSHKKLRKKNRQLISTVEKVEMLEEKLENNIFKDIIELAKSNSPEFLPLFGKGYPEFVGVIKELDPAIRSSELYFIALAYLNFSTKDIANYTFVTTRAVQVRKNRMRKKYNIPSEVDFNEWFRSLSNGGGYR